MSNGSRFSELRQLFFDSGLTTEEARYLRLLLSDIQTDLIGELPLEIVISIALELEPFDFARCLCVSTAWRQRFLSDSVMRAYAWRRWPATIDGVVNQSKFLESLAKVRWAFSSNRRAEKVVFVRWDRKGSCPLDPVFHTQPNNLPGAYLQYSVDPDSVRPPAIYADGKLAWCVPHCVIVIDDLRSRTRKVFTPPSGTMHGLALKLRSLGSRLAIGTVDRLLIAWDHIDNQAYEKSLPSRVLQCTTQNSRVAVVLYGGDVVTWTSSHASIQLDTLSVILELGMNPSQAETWKGSLNVFFDPRNSKNLYLASGYLFQTESERMVRVTVHEFLGSVHVASWSSDCKDDPEWYNDARLLKPRIVPVELEVQYSSIIFKRRVYISIGRPVLSFLTIFDKIKRKFVDFNDEDDLDRDNEEDYDDDSARDLNFNVKLHHQSYSFKQFQKK